MRLLYQQRNRQEVRSSFGTKCTGRVTT